MKGIEQGLDLPREAEDDVWSLTERERTSLGHRAAAQEPQRGDRDRRDAPSCSPRPSASTSSTSSCATSARSGTSTAARSPPSSATGCCRSSDGRTDDRLQPRPGHTGCAWCSASWIAVAVLGPRSARGVHPGRAASHRGAGVLAMVVAGRPARGRGLRAQAARVTPGAPPRSPPSSTGGAAACCPGSALAGTWLAFLLPLIGARRCSSSRCSPTTRRSAS